MIDRNKIEHHKSIQKIFQGLESCLGELCDSYKKIISVLEVEKKHLISGSTDEMFLANIEKESLLKKISGIEGLRLGFAASLARSLGLPDSTPKLLDLANALKGQPEELVLRDWYQRISEVIQKVQELNSENEVLVVAALRSVGGALDNIKDSLAGKKTYRRSGQFKSGPEQSGNFISKEA
jgi:flagellar biosynthesis/type III secretory pathway chaperone